MVTTSVRRLKRNQRLRGLGVGAAGTAAGSALVTAAVFIADLSQDLAIGQRFFQFRRAGGRHFASVEVQFSELRQPSRCSMPASVYLRANKTEDFELGQPTDAIQRTPAAVIRVPSRCNHLIFVNPRTCFEIGVSGRRIGKLGTDNVSEKIVPQHSPQPRRPRRPQFLHAVPLAILIVIVFHAAAQLRSRPQHPPPAAAATRLDAKPAQGTTGDGDEDQQGAQTETKPAATRRCYCGQLIGRTSRVFHSGILAGANQLRQRGTLRTLATTEVCWPLRFLSHSTSPQRTACTTACKSGSTATCHRQSLPQ